MCSVVLFQRKKRNKELDGERLFLHDMPLSFVLSFFYIIYSLDIRFPAPYDDGIRLPHALTITFTMSFDVHLFLQTREKAHTKLDPNVLSSFLCYPFFPVIPSSSSHDKDYTPTSAHTISPVEAHAFPFSHPLSLDGLPEDFHTSPCLTVSFGTVNRKMIQVISFAADPSPVFEADRLRLLLVLVNL